MTSVKKVAFHTLGCKLNFTESSTIARSFKENGYELTDFSNKADFYVINTCSVTENADKKFKNILNKAKRNSWGVLSWGLKISSPGYCHRNRILILEFLLAR